MEIPNSIPISAKTFQLFTISAPKFDDGIGATGDDNLTNSFGERFANETETNRIRTRFVTLKNL